LIVAGTLGELEAVFRSGNFEGAVTWAPAERFAQALGLGPEAWVEYRDVEENGYPGAISVE
jgi:hypothetical protein